MKLDLSTFLNGCRSSFQQLPLGSYGRLVIGGFVVGVIGLQQLTNAQHSATPTLQTRQPSPSTAVAMYPDQNGDTDTGNMNADGRATGFVSPSPHGPSADDAPVHVYPPDVSVEQRPHEARRSDNHPGNYVASGHALGGHARSNQPHGSRALNRPASTPQAVEEQSGSPIHVYPPGIEPPPRPIQKNAAKPSQPRPLHSVSMAQSGIGQSGMSGHSGYSFAAPQTNTPLVIQPPATLDPPSGHGFTAEVFEAPGYSDPVPMGFAPLNIQPAHEIKPTELSDDRLSWWERDIAGPVLRGRNPITMSLEMAIGLSLSEAPELQVLHSEWFIQQIEITRQDAAFDWTSFVEGVWNRDSNPVSSTLDGATNRLRSRTGSVNAGGRRLFRDGGEFEVSQQVGLRSSNSDFISPNNQGNSRLQFEWQHPLLRGGGEDYNTSPVRIAAIEKDSSFDRFQIGVQDHLLEVASAYWVLVLRRGRFVQAVASWNRSREIELEMAGRVNVDVTPIMLDRTRSEVASRLATSIEAEHDTIRAQDALLRLIYGSRFVEFASNEVVTQTLPMKQSRTVDPAPQVQRALRTRSEIHRAIRDIKLASVRYNVAENEILPVLDMTLSGYVSGLRGNSDIGGSFVNQFSEGEPGIGIGFNYEIPYRNRAAEAAAEQGRIAIKRMQAALQTSIADVTEDVRAQVINRNKFGAVLQSQWESLARARRILKNTQARRDGLADGPRVADLYLENLLQMQSRLEAAEFTFLQSQVRYAVADNSLLRAVSNIDSLAADTGNVGGPAAAIRQASASSDEAQTNYSAFGQVGYATFDAEVSQPPIAPIAR